MRNGIERRSVREMNSVREMKSMREVKSGTERNQGIVGDRECLRTNDKYQFNSINQCYYIPFNSM